MQEDARIKQDEENQSSAVNPLITGQQANVEEQMRQVFQSALHAEVSNFPTDKMVRWQLSALARGPQCLSFDDIVDQSFPIKYFYAHRVEMTKPGDGEIISSTRCVLIDENLRAVSFVSDGIAVDLARMAQAFGLKPWEPPLVVKVVRTQSKNKRYFYSLVPVIDA